MFDACFKETELDLKSGTLKVRYAFWNKASGRRTSRINLLIDGERAETRWTAEARFREGPAEIGAVPRKLLNVTRVKWSSDGPW